MQENATKRTSDDWRLHTLTALRRSLAHQAPGATPPTSPVNVAEGLAALTRLSTIIEAPVPESPPPVEPDADPKEQLRQLLAGTPQNPLLASWIRFQEVEQLREVLLPPIQRPLIYLYQPSAAAPAPTAEAPALTFTEPDPEPTRIPTAEYLAPEPAAEPTFTADILPPPESRRPSVTAFIAAALVLVVIAMGWYVLRPPQERASNNAAVLPVASKPTAPVPPGWQRRTADQKNGARDVLVAQNPWSDTAPLDFTWDLRSGSIEWTLNYQDDKNYSAYGIEVLSKKPYRFLLYRYVMARGVEGPHAQIPTNGDVVEDPVLRLSTITQRGVWSLQLNGLTVDRWPQRNRGSLALLSQLELDPAWIKLLQPRGAQ